MQKAILQPATPYQANKQAPPINYALKMSNPTTLTALHSQNKTTTPANTLKQKTPQRHHKQLS